MNELKFKIIETVSTLLLVLMIFGLVCFAFIRDSSENKQSTKKIKTIIETREKELKKNADEIQDTINIINNYLDKYPMRETISE